MESFASNLPNRYVLRAAHFSLPPDIDDCASNPCLNGATCLDEVYGYNCSCVVGFTGYNCQIGRHIFSKLQSTDSEMIHALTYLAEIS